MGKKKNRRKTFMHYYWPFLAAVFGPVVIFVIFVLIYSLVSKSTWLLNPAVYLFMSAMLFLLGLYKLSYWAYVVIPLIFSIPVFLLVFGAIISAKKAKRAKALINIETNEQETNEQETGGQIDG